jgi:hypothetical protein
MMLFDEARRSGAGAILGAALLIGGCSDDPAPPFSITGSGDVEGLLFLDANEDAIFDPSAGDQPLEGVRVVARNRGTDEVLSGGTATTDAGGRFTLSDLPPGSHDVYFDETTIPEGVSVCRNPIPTTVYLDETRFEGVAARPACLITITAAKELPLGEFVIVRGIVTSFPGQMRSSYTQIQDDDTGIRLFGSNLEGLGIEIGDLLEVGGTLTQFGGDLQLDPVTLREHIEDVANPVPDPTTTGAIAAAGADPQAALGGRLVSVSAAQLTRGFTSGGDRNGLIDDGSGATELRIEAALSGSGDATIRTTLGMTVGNCYDIVGTVGAFGGVGQLFPRSAEDITEVTCN